jgi:FkbM family methyltransferase
VGQTRTTRPFPLVASASTIPAPLDSTAVADVRTDVGDLFVHADDAVLRPVLEAEGRWEPDESDFLRAHIRPGSVFLDVGANIGYMTILGARACAPGGRVIAVEPEARNIAVLRANLWRHGVDALVLPAAAYSRRDFLHLALSETNPGDHQVHATHGEAMVPCLRLDDHLGEVKIDVAKIDTQGTDHEVLAGMEGLIRRNPSLVALAEFWLEGMEQRNVEPLRVLADYRAQGFRLGLLRSGATASAASDDEIVAACEAWGGRYVNVVLLGPTTPAPAGWS